VRNNRHDFFFFHFIYLLSFYLTNLILKETNHNNNLYSTI